jgi:transcriptional regulator with GAF, ATPase, and Fis domain
MEATPVGGQFFVHHSGPLSLRVVRMEDCACPADLIRDAIGAGSSLVVATYPPGNEPAAHELWACLAAGAREVLPWNDDLPEQVEALCFREARLQELEAEARSFAIGRSAVWRRTIQNCIEAAHFSTTPVLILGPTGTGKEVLAQAVHRFDGRREKREMVTVDCTNLSPELSGSELFGHERGAFTGAVQQREGAIALAHKGTLFLDEVGELPLPLQAQLLRVLQEGSYRRVGANTWNHVEFRLVCATNRDLATEVAAGRFRADLFHRLASTIVQSPALEERREDIPDLAHHFLQQAGHSGEMHEAVVAQLAARRYPGNVRELRQLMAKILLRHVGQGPIRPGDLPPDERPLAAQLDTMRSWPNRDLDFETAIARAIDAGATLSGISEAAKDVAIRIAAQRENGNVQRTAKRLGVTDRALQLRKASGAKNG